MGRGVLLGFGLLYDVSVKVITPARAVDGENQEVMIYDAPSGVQTISITNHVDSTDVGVHFDLALQYPSTNEEDSDFEHIIDSDDDDDSDFDDDLGSNKAKKQTKKAKKRTRKPKQSKSASVQSASVPTCELFIFICADTFVPDL